MPKNRAAVALGKIGGRVTSERKAQASRENGKKGGRPKKTGKVVQPADPSIRHVELTRGFVAIVDVGDYEWLNGFNWFATLSKNGPYAYRTIQINGRGASLTMHRLITGAEPGEIVDHKDGNTLNNRRSNLRKCTQAQNLMNARLRSDNESGVKGVHFDRFRNKWAAFISINGRSKNLGRFATIDEAKSAYASAAVIHFGEFARVSG
jgi:hypothetical protein